MPLPLHCPARSSHDNIGKFSSICLFENCLSYTLQDPHALLTGRPMPSIIEHPHISFSIIIPATVDRGRFPQNWSSDAGGRTAVYSSCRQHRRQGGVHTRIHESRTYPVPGSLNGGPVSSINIISSQWWSVCTTNYSSIASRPSFPSCPCSANSASDRR
jgi:hypothetical protein